jgi:UDP-2,3-diacylglucosamine hydrolase
MWVAPQAWHTLEFISDLHLSAQTPKTFKAWHHYMLTTQADAVFILGDLVDAWVGDDSRLSGFEAVFTKVLAGVAQLRPTYFMVGNRDFLLGHDMLKACGVLAMPDPTSIHAFGEQGLFVHGDQLCLNDAPYQAFRAQVRQTQWQADFLKLPLEKRRLIAREMRDQSKAHQRDRGIQTQVFDDVDAATALEWLVHCGATFLVHGHTHFPGTDRLSPSRARHVLSDWDLEQTPPRAEVLRWTERGIDRVGLST